MWTYNNDPDNDTTDELRFLIGDTDSGDPQLTDEEIAYLIGKFSTVVVAAIYAVENLAAKYARLVDKSVGDLSLSYSQRQKHYQDLVRWLRTQAALAGGTSKPYAGGISIADKEIDETDTDRVLPAFRRGLHGVKQSGNAE